MKTNPKGYNMFRECGKTKVILYKTIIVVFDGDTITLNSGGWRTAHTKKCMNIALKDSGYRVFQKKGDWYIKHNAGSEIVFTDNIKIPQLVDEHDWALYE